MAFVPYLLLLVVCGQTVGFALPLQGLHRAERMAVGFGLSFAVPLVASSLLLSLGLFSTVSLTALLVGTTLLCALAIHRRGFGWRRPRELTRTLAVLLATGLICAIATFRYAYSYLDSSLFYLTYGSYVLAPYTRYPMLHAFGNEYVFPFLQLKYALVFPTMLLSSGDPFEYHRFGVPVISACVGPAVAASGYCFFRRYLGPASALVVLAVFLTGGLYAKVLSVRAETLGWLPAFAFLLLLASCLRADRPRWSSWLVAAALLVTTALLHGIVAFVAVFVGTGMWLHAMLWGARRARRARLVGALGAAAFAAALLGGIYHAVHLKHTSGVAQAFFEIDRKRPEAGEIDPGRRFLDLYARSAKRARQRRVRAHPPAVSLADNVRIALLDPAQEPFQELGKSGGRAFMALGLLSLAWLLVRRPRRCLSFPLLLGLSGAIAALFAYSVWLNYSSVAWFPWAVVPRRFASYVSCCAGSLYAVAILSVLGSRFRRTSGRRVGRLVCIAVALAVFSLPIFNWNKSKPVDQAPFLTRDFLAAMRHVRDHSQLGDRGVANFGSMGHMAYLAGIPFASEGVMPYEVYRLIKKNAASLERTRSFLARPNRAYVRDFGIRFVVLARSRAAIRGRFRETARLRRFRGARKVFDSRRFVVLEYPREEPGR